MAECATDLITASRLPRSWPNLRVVHDMLRRIMAADSRLWQKPSSLPQTSPSKQSCCHAIQYIHYSLQYDLPQFCHWPTWSPGPFAQFQQLQLPWLAGCIKMDLDVYQLGMITSNNRDASIQQQWPLRLALKNCVTGKIRSINPLRSVLLFLDRVNSCFFWKFAIPHFFPSTPLSLFQGIPNL